MYGNTKSNVTIQYYDINADAFVQSTINADMNILYKKFEALLSCKGKILDLGCGSGRDSKYFYEEGYEVLSMDASVEMCKRTSMIAKTEIVHGYAEEIEYLEEFDGIWACASLLHINGQKMPSVMEKIARALKPGGVLYASWKYGLDSTYVGERFYQYETPNSVKKYIDNIACMKVHDIWLTDDVRESTNQKWVNLLAVKNG